MEAIAYHLTHTTMYVSLFVFVGGIVYQMYAWRQKSPLPVHLSLYPRPESRVARWGDALVDMFAMRNLFRMNKPLWIGGFIMHLGLLLLFLGHIRTVTDFYFLWDILGWGEQQQHQFSAVAGTTAGVLFMVPIFYLLGRRWSGAVKWLSIPEDYFVLFLLIGIAFTGMHMRLVLEVDQHAIRDFMQGLFAFNWQPLPESAGWSFVYHMIFAQILMIYFPFGKLMHACGSVFAKMVARS